MSNSNKEKLEIAENNVRDAKRILEDLESELYEARARGLRDAGYDPEDLAVSESWDCEKSPVGKCVYEAFEDPCHDHCIFCGLPEERK